MSAENGQPPVTIPTNLSDDAVHPLAAIFPMVADDELAVLAADIKQNGLRDPIATDESGRIVDGRNRFAACQRAKVEPTFITIKGTDAEIAAFIISRNVHRRHLTTGQRAMATALVLALLDKRRNGRWVRGSIPAIPDIGNSTWHNAMTQAGIVVDADDPDLVKAVVNGDTYLHVAVELVNSTAKMVVDVPPTSENVQALEEQADQPTDDDAGGAEPVAVDDAEKRERGAPPVETKKRGHYTGETAQKRRERADLQRIRDDEGLREVRPLLLLVEQLNVAIIDGDVRHLTGHPRARVAEDLERLRVTIDNLLSALARKEAGQ